MTVGLDTGGGADPDIVFLLAIAAHENGFASTENKNENIAMKNKEIHTSLS